MKYSPYFWKTQFCILDLTKITGYETSDMRYNKGHTNIVAITDSGERILIFEDMSFDDFWKKLNDILEKIGGM